MPGRSLRRNDAKRSNRKILETPVGLETEYRRRLRNRVTNTQRFLSARLKAGGVSITVARAAERAWRNQNRPSFPWLSGFANRVEASAVRRTDTVIARVAKINVGTLPSGRSAGAINQAFVARNVRLIRSIDERYFNDVVRVIGEATAQGQSPKELSKVLRQRFNVSKSRADLIARDQTSKFNGQVSMFRQRELGITRFEWQTSEDSRVREEHVILNGQIFEYSNPPSEGLPGQPIDCRCVGLPVMDI